MPKDEDIIKELIAAGLIGAGLGALISEKSEDGAILGAIAGAVLIATHKANVAAQKTNVPVYVEESGTLYEIMPGGEKRFIKEIKKPARTLPEFFKLK